MRVICDGKRIEFGSWREAMEFVELGLDPVFEKQWRADAFWFAIHAGNVGVLLL